MDPISSDPIPVGSSSEVGKITCSPEMLPTMVLSSSSSSDRHHHRRSIKASSSHRNGSDSSSTSTASGHRTSHSTSPSSSLPSSISSHHPAQSQPVHSLARPPSWVELTEVMRSNPSRWQQLRIETDAARLISSSSTKSHRMMTSTSTSTSTGTGSSSSSSPSTTNNATTNSNTTTTTTAPTPSPPNQHSAPRLTTTHPPPPPPPPPPPHHHHTNIPSSSTPSAACSSISLPSSSSTLIDPATTTDTLSLTPDHPSDSSSPSSSTPITSGTTSRLRLPPYSSPRHDRRSTHVISSTTTTTTTSSSPASSTATSSSTTTTSSSSSDYPSPSGTTHHTPRLSSLIYHSSNPHHRSNSTHHLSPLSKLPTQSELDPSSPNKPNHRHHHRLLLQRRASTSDINLGLNRARAPSLAAIQERIARLKPDMMPSTTTATTPTPTPTPDSNRSSQQPTLDPNSTSHPNNLASQPQSSSTPQASPPAPPPGLENLNVGPEKKSEESVLNNSISASIPPNQTQPNDTHHQEPITLNSSSINPQSITAEKIGQNGSVGSSQDLHPLQHSWTLYFDSRNLKRSPTVGGNHHHSTGGQAYEAGLQTIGTFKSVEQFCRFFNWTVAPSQMEMNSSVQIFKAHIKPMWEDPANAKGGKWTLTMKSNSNLGLLDKLWTYLVLGLVGEQIEAPTNPPNPSAANSNSNQDDDLICGAIVATRPRGNRIQIWVKEKDNIEKINSLGKRLINILEINDYSGVSVEFSAHTGGSHGSSKFISIQGHSNSSASHHRGANAHSTPRSVLEGMVMGGLGKGLDERGAGPIGGGVPGSLMRRSTSAELNQIGSGGRMNSGVGGSIVGSGGALNPHLHHHHPGSPLATGGSPVFRGGLTGPAGSIRTNQQLSSNDTPIQNGVWRPSSGLPSTTPSSSSPVGPIPRPAGLPAVIGQSAIMASFSSGNRRPQSTINLTTLGSLSSSGSGSLHPNSSNHQPNPSIPQAQQPPVSSSAKDGSIPMNPKLGSVDHPSNKSLSPQNHHPSRNPSPTPPNSSGIGILSTGAST